MINTTGSRIFPPKIKAFFSNAAPPAQRYRSLTGLAIALLLIPALLVVMACFTLPVPLGDPEKSRVDPDLSGVWIISDNEEFDGFLVLEPWDKRSWMVALAIELSINGESLQGGLDEPVNNEEQPETPTIELLRQNRLEINEVAFYKGWLTRIKGQRFITWEPKMFTDFQEDSESEEPHWWVFQIRESDENELILDVVDPSEDDREQIETRSQLEKFIRRNIDKPELYLKDLFHFHKLGESDREAVIKLLEEFGINE